MAFGLALGAWLLRSARKQAAAFVVIACALLFIDSVEDGYHRLAPRQSGERVAGVMRQHLTPGMRLYSVRHYEQSVPFYIGRTLTLVDYWDEFTPGLKAQPDLALADLEAFGRDWMRPGEAMAIIQPDAIESFRASGLPMTLLYRDERRALVRKP
jgi:hypothetical protein